MMKKLIFIFAIGIFLTACSSVMLTGRKQLLLVSDSEVLSSSALAYTQLIDSVPLSKNATNTAMVKRVGSRIAKAVITYMAANGFAADTANYKWEFNLVKDTVVNAFCMPGGKVVVYEGILPVTQNETGLAVVLGHEIAHAVAKHSNERMSQQMLVQYGASFVDMAVASKAAATRQTINTVYGIGSQVGVMLPYSRKHEYEADRLGLIFMAMAGYDPNEAVAFWQRMAASSGSSVPEVLSTHPSDQNRIIKMKENIVEAMKYYKK